MKANEMWSRVINNQRWALAVALSAGILIFLNIFFNSFVGDDFELIVNCPFVQHLDNLPGFFTDHANPLQPDGVYTPVRTFMFFVLYHIFGAHPFGCHVFSILVHLCGIGLVYRLIQLLTERRAAAFLGALIFAVHPLHTQGIVMMSASIDTAGHVFFLAALYFYIRMFRSSAEVMNPGDYQRSLIFFLLGVLTRPLTAIFFPAFFCYDGFFSPRRGRWNEVLKRVVPFVMIWILSVLLNGPFPKFFALDLYTGFFAVACLIAWSVVGAYDRLHSRRRYAGTIIIAAVTLWLVSCCVRTWLRNGHYRNNLTYYRQAVLDHPSDLSSRLALGVVYTEEGLPEEAIRQFRAAEIMEPDNPEIYFLMEPAYSRLGEYQTSYDLLRKAVALKPDYAEAYFNLAGLTTFMGRDKEGYVYFQKAIDLWKDKGMVLEAGQAFEQFQLFLLDRKGELTPAAAEKFLDATIRR